MHRIIVSLLIAVISLTASYQAPSIVDARPEIRPVETIETIKAVDTHKVAEKLPTLVTEPLEQALAPSGAYGANSSIEQIVRSAAVKFGIDPDYFVSIAICESGLDPNNVNYNYYENGYPSGLFQHLSGYWPQRAIDHGYPGASVFDPVANANVTASMWASGSRGLWEC